MKLRWLILFLVLWTISCSKEKLPKGILSKDKMIPVLVDQHIADLLFVHRFAVGVKSDNAMDDLYLSVLKKHGVDQKVFEESVFYYGKHPDKYKPIYDEVLNRLNEMSVKAKQEDPTLKRK